MNLNLSKKFLNELMKEPSSEYFKMKLTKDYLGNVSALYFEKIKKPLDLRTIEENLAKGFYIFDREVFDDVELVFNNAITFHKPPADIFYSAKNLLEITQSKRSTLQIDLLYSKTILQHHREKLERLTDKKIDAKIQEKLKALYKTIFQILDKDTSIPSEIYNLLYSGSAPLFNIAFNSQLKERCVFASEVYVELETFKELVQKYLPLEKKLIYNIGIFVIGFLKYFEKLSQMNRELFKKVLDRIDSEASSQAISSDTLKKLCLFRKKPVQYRFLSKELKDDSGKFAQYIIFLLFLDVFWDKMEKGENKQGEESGESDQKVDTAKEFLGQASKYLNGLDCPNPSPWGTLTAFKNIIVENLDADDRVFVCGKLKGVWAAFVKNSHLFEISINKEDILSSIKKNITGRFEKQAANVPEVNGTERESLLSIREVTLVLSEIATEVFERVLMNSVEHFDESKKKTVHFFELHSVLKEGFARLEKRVNEAIVFRSSYINESITFFLLRMVKKEISLIVLDNFFEHIMKKFSFKNRKETLIFSSDNFINKIFRLSKIKESFGASNNSDKKGLGIEKESVIYSFCKFEVERIRQEISFYEAFVGIGDLKNEIVWRKLEKHMLNIYCFLKAFGQENILSEFKTGLFDFYKTRNKYPFNKYFSK